MSQLIAGDYPNYVRLIPKTFESKSTTKTAELARAVRMASVISKESSNILRLQVLKDKILLTARSEDTGDNSGEVEAALEGPDSKIGFDYRYLRDVLAVIDEESVLISTNSPSLPAAITPVGNDNYLYVLMPMFVQW